jgi:hypothetical protein
MKCRDLGVAARRRILASLAALAIMTVSSASPLAPRVAAGEAAGQVGTADLTTDRDTQSYAREFGVTSAEAAFRLSLQGPVSELDAALERIDAADFGGLWIQNAPDFRVEVRLAGDGSSVLEMAKGTALDGLVDVLPARYSRDELVSAASALRAGTATAPFDLVVNVQDNELDVRTLAAADVTAFAAARGRALPPSARIVEVPALARPATEVYGGLALPDCTTGFTVSKSGTRGVLTAGHCSNSESIYNTSLTLMGEAYSGSNDEQWMYSASFSFTNKAADFAPDWRRITSRTYRKNQPIGSWVCKYGKVTGYGCGTITQTNAAPGYIPNVKPTYVYVAHSVGYPLLCQGGDSGGPVYLSNSAWGIIEGLNGTTNWTDLMYTQTDYVEGGLGVTIVTS